MNICPQCSKSFFATTSKVNWAKKKGAPLYCGRVCSGLARRVEARQPSWYQQRFEPHPGRIECSCLACGRAYWLPKCHVGQRTTCGIECRRELNRRAKAARQRDCACCGAAFTPRTTQIAASQGLYCSLRCSTKGNGQLWTPQAREKVVASLKAAIADGTFVPRSGEAHAQWKGGRVAARRRRVESGKSRETRRKYLAANPHKAREFSAKRRGLKTGRLPRGTVQRIGKAQRWRCACCKVGLSAGYHLDHIEPLARGGKHEPKNVQLLCPPCNLRKSAKDPIAFMQERGFLL